MTLMELFQSDAAWREPKTNMTKRKKGVSK